MAELRPPSEAETAVEAEVARRVRYLRKKLDRIATAEHKAAEGKELTKEQAELINSRQAVQGALDELHHSFPKLEAASVRDREAHSCRQYANTREQKLQTEPEDESANSSDHSHAAPVPANWHQAQPAVHELLPIIYLGFLFDSTASSSDWSHMKQHEREACKSYMESTISDRELDMLVETVRLLTQRSTYAFVSHEEALHSCASHANKLLERSKDVLPLRVPTAQEQMTYADIRAYTDAICSSDFFTIEPVQVNGHHTPGMPPPAAAPASQPRFAAAQAPAETEVSADGTPGALCNQGIMLSAAAPAGTVPAAVAQQQQMSTAHVVPAVQSLPTQQPHGAQMPDYGMVTAAAQQLQGGQQQQQHKRESVHAQAGRGGQRTGRRRKAGRGSTVEVHPNEMKPQQQEA